MNPANYDELTLDEMEYDLVTRINVCYQIANEVIGSMLGIPSLPEAVELSVMEFNCDTF